MLRETLSLHYRSYNPSNFLSKIYDITTTSRMHFWCYLTVWCLLPPQLIHASFVTLFTFLRRIRGMLVKIQGNFCKKFQVLRKIQGKYLKNWKKFCFKFLSLWQLLHLQTPVTFTLLIHFFYHWFSNLCRLFKSIRYSTNGSA